MIVHISYRRFNTSEEVFRFSTKVKSLNEALDQLYMKHPEASWIGYKTIPIFD